MRIAPNVLILFSTMSIPLGAQDSLWVAVDELDEVFPTSANESDATRINKRVAWIDSLIESDDTIEKKFARVGTEFQETDVVNSVVAGGDWPSGMSTSYTVHTGETGVLAVVEVPTSFSGDWYNFTVHYFSVHGKTIAVRRYSSFEVGCGFRDSGESRPSSGHEESLFSFNLSGELIEKTYGIGTLDGASVDAASCSFDYRFPYGMLRSWASYAQANGLDSPGN
jgi:hypothetical protein